MKKDVKVKWLGLWGDVTVDSFFFTRILSEKYNVIESEDPDYVICSVFGKPYAYCKYDCIRIMCSAENYCPDFNFIDYAMGYDEISFGDRYFRYGACYSLELANKTRKYAKSILDEKNLFANFIAGHESEYSIRGDFFKKLCEYKTVTSMGSYLNNMTDGKIVCQSEKREYQKKCKFTLCFESTRYPNFCTEKIVDAFLADTIPIYYGDPNVGKIFNPKAFINAADYNSFEEILEKIIELDTDDEQYLAMLNEPVYLEPNMVAERYQALKEWIFSIFDQPKEEAYRRSRVYMPKMYENSLLDKYEPYESILEMRGHRKTTLKKRFANHYPTLYAAIRKCVKH